MIRRALMYHDIEDAPTRRRYSFTAAEFAAHVEAVAAVPGEWLVTFDDGHPGWTKAAAILEAKGRRGAFFAVSAWVGAPGRASAADLRALAAAGHEVGSHSADHPDRLAGRDFAFIKDQWSRSKAALEEVLGRPVDSASVPGGSYSPEVARAAAEAGLRRLYTSEPVAASWAAGGCEAFGRYAMTNGMGPADAAALAAGRWSATAPQWAAWNLKKAAKAAVGGPYRALRRAMFEGVS